MPIPSVRQIMIPLLEMVSHGEEYRLRDIMDSLADHFSLTGEERMERIPSGQGRFRKNCQWAEFRMTQRGFLESTRRGYHRITEQGRAELRQNSDVSRGVTEETMRHDFHGTTERGLEVLKEASSEAPNVTEEAIRRIVREEIERAKQELKRALREAINISG